MCAKTVMTRISHITRWLSLSMLFGGSIATIIAAVTLVKAAQAQGIAVSEAAAANAPVFIQFSKVAVACGFALLIAEGLAFATRLSGGPLTFARYLSSFLCAVTTMIFAFAIVPPMEQLQKSLMSDPQAQTEFHRLHESSRVVFGATILLALVSLVLPAFESAQVRIVNPGKLPGDETFTTQSSGKASGNG